MIQLQETMVRRSTANASEHPADATRCYSERALDSKMKKHNARPDDRATSQCNGDRGIVCRNGMRQSLGRCSAVMLDGWLVGLVWDEKEAACVKSVGP